MESALNRDLEVCHAMKRLPRSRFLFDSREFPEPTVDFACRFKRQRRQTGARAGGIMRQQHFVMIMGAAILSTVAGTVFGAIAG